jgi:hypothetical protein
MSFSWNNVMLLVVGLVMGSSLLLMPSQARAQVCGTQIELDDFGCRNLGTDFLPDCQWVYLGTRSNKACSMQGPNCLTNDPYCTSADNANDSCIPELDIGDGDTYYCLTNIASCLKAQCWITGTAPTPTMPPGANPGGCYGCSSNGGGFCMWHDSCPSWGVSSYTL